MYAPKGVLPYLYRFILPYLSIQYTLGIILELISDETTILIAHKLLLGSRLSMFGLHWWRSVGSVSVIQL